MDLSEERAMAKRPWAALTFVRGTLVKLNKASKPSLNMCLVDPFIPGPTGPREESRDPPPRRLIKNFKTNVKTYCCLVGPFISWTRNAPGGVPGTPGRFNTTSTLALNHVLLVTMTRLKGLIIAWLQPGASHAPESCPPPPLLAGFWLCPLSFVCRL